MKTAASPPQAVKDKLIDISYEYEEVDWNIHCLSLLLSAVFEPKQEATSEVHEQLHATCDKSMDIHYQYETLDCQLHELGLQLDHDNSEKATTTPVMIEDDVYEELRVMLMLSAQQIDELDARIAQLKVIEAAIYERDQKNIIAKLLQKCSRGPQSLPVTKPTNFSQLASAK